MATKECPKCESRSGLNMMKGKVTQLMNFDLKQPMITEWTCGFCGFKDTDTVYMSSLGGNQNTKSIINEIDENTILQGVRPPEAPLNAAKPKAPLKAAKPKVVNPEPFIEPTKDIVD